MSNLRARYTNVLIYSICFIKQAASNTVFNLYRPQLCAANASHQHALTDHRAGNFSTASL